MCKSYGEQTFQSLQHVSAAHAAWHQVCTEKRDLSFTEAGELHFCKKHDISRQNQSESPWDIQKWSAAASNQCFFDPTAHCRAPPACLLFSSSTTSLSLGIIRCCRSLITPGLLFPTFKGRITGSLKVLQKAGKRLRATTVRVSYKMPIDPEILSGDNWTVKLEPCLPLWWPCRALAVNTILQIQFRWSK